MNHCPGLYCGREILPNNSLSECGSCPRGFRRNDSFICIPCTDSPSFYDWLYLGFMVLLILVLHWFFIDFISQKRSLNKDVLILQVTAFCEVCISAILSILFSQPFGTFSVRSCRVQYFSDWYTLLNNPTPNYDRKIHCTQEAVYPLYTIVFVFYTLTLVLMLVIRPIVFWKLLPGKSRMSIYAAMYYIPILILTHALFGGILYYAFPYLTIILSVISVAAHLAVKIEQNMFSLIITSIVNPRNLIILLGHWCLHAYGIISITELADPLCHGLMMLLVPLPTLFYILTAQFTDPQKSPF